MKIIISVLGLINGSYMLLDGLFVILKGKYIGPELPGPWANIFYRFNVNVFKLGPLFILFGIAWLMFIIGLWTNQSWVYMAGLIISIATLWYLPLGTLFSSIILIMLLTSRQKLGL